MKPKNKSFLLRPLPVFAGMLATLAGLPVSSVLAQSFPSFPLQTGAGNVEPNIMFILDDSGSMADTWMPNPDLLTICRRDNNGNCTGISNLAESAYPGNSLAFNPATDYSPWVTEAGSPMSGGTTFSSVYASFNHAGPGASGGESDVIDLANAASCETYRVNSVDANTTVCGGVQTYMLPIDPGNVTAAYRGNAVNYYRYQIRPVNGVTEVVRSRLLSGGGLGSVPNPGNSTTNYDTALVEEDDDNDGGQATNIYVDVRNGWFSASTAHYAGGGGTGNLRLRVFDPSGNRICDANANNSGAVENCGTLHGLPSGEFRFQLYVFNGNQNRDLTNVRLSVTTGGNGCTAPGGSTWAWGGCEVQSLTTDAKAALLENYATWFSYHRTRMKIAKAGAAGAFEQLGDNVRVGFRTLHQNNGNTNLDIPVSTNGGIFSGTSRTTWFAKLFNSRGRQGTPLRGVLKATGDYFSDASATGPYGPAATNQLACRQNFAILTTDGYWNGNTDSNDGGMINVGEQDGTAGPSIIDPRFEVGEEGYDEVRYTRQAPYADRNNNTNFSDTLADVAMSYWKRDLRSDLDNIVPTSEGNGAFWQHMVTFGVSIGLKGTVDQTSVAQIVQDGGPQIGGGTPGNWPDPTDNENAERIDDLLHAAVNGHGEFIAVTNADRFRDALVDVLGAIQSRLASGSNVATNSATFLAGAKMFQATYRTGQWYGDVIARDVTDAGISASELWRASERITAAGAAHANRTVLTSTGTAGANFPTAAQTALLARTTGFAQVSGADNAAYIRGNQSLEQSAGGLLRNRVTVLGDIVNSSPFYTSDTRTLYVGANDGMLHAFNADNGNTLFSYLPAGVNLANLANISDPGYTHSFFMDGPVTVSGDRVVAETNYLVGTLGRGGKGAFALNVTTPATMDSGDVLWDHTAATDADMGYVIGIPMIVKGNNDELLALVPNGIDSTNGGAHLYIYDVTDGSLIRKLSTSATGGNGLSAPRANDRNADQKVDYVYAGDLLGNVWKFDLSSTDPADWEVDLGGEPLFTATDADGNPQPITGGVALARDAAADKRFVTFGTGRLIQTSDVTSEDVQSLYGIIDADEPVESRDELEEHSIAAVWEGADGVTRRAFENFQALPATAKGWVVDLGIPTPGERVIGGAQVNGRAAIISSVIPAPGEGCESDGSGFLNAIDVFTGTSPEASGGGGATTSFFDTTGGNTQTVVVDGVTYSTGSINMGVGLHGDGGLVNNGTSIVVCGSDATCEDEDLGAPEGGAPEPRRTSWRELFGED